MTEKKLLTQAERNAKAGLAGRGKRGIARARRAANGEKAAKLRIEGYSWREISEACGYASAGSAYKAWKVWEAKQNQETITEIRAVQRSRLEKIIKALNPKLEQGSTRHAEVAIKALEREAKLLGLDADAGTQNGAKQGITIIINPDPRDPRAARLIEETREREDRILLPPIEGTLLEEENNSPDRR